MVLATCVAQVQTSDILRILHQAAELAGTVQEPSKKASLLLAIAGLQAKTGDSTAAGRTFQNALQAGAEIEDDEIRPQVIAQVVFAQVDVGDLEGAYQAAVPLDDYYLRTGLFREIVTGSLRSGDIAGALEVAKAQRHGVLDRPEVLAEIVKAYARMGDVEAALQIADALPTFGMEWADARESIAIAQAKAGDLEAALETSGSLEAIALAQAEAGDPTGAAKTFQQAYQRLESEELQDSSHARGIAQALTQIASSQARAGNRVDAAKALRKAFQIVERFRAENRGKIDLLRTSIFETIARAQLETGDIEGAVETAQLEEYAPGRGGLLLEAADAHRKRGNLQGVEEITDLVQDPWARSLALVIFAQALAEKGDQASAAAELRRAADAASGITNENTPFGINGEFERARVLSLVASVQTQVGDSEAAVASFQRALRIAEGSNPSEDDFFTLGKAEILAAVAQSQAEAGDVKAALKTTTAIRSVPGKSDIAEGVLYKIARTQACSEDFEGAAKWAADQTSASAKVSALVGTAAGMLECGSGEERPSFLDQQSPGFEAMKRQSERLSAVRPGAQSPPHVVSWNVRMTVPSSLQCAEADRLDSKQHIWETTAVESAEGRGQVEIRMGSCGKIIAIEVSRDLLQGGLTTETLNEPEALEQLTQCIESRACVDQELWLASQQTRAKAASCVARCVGPFFGKVL